MKPTYTSTSGTDDVWCPFFVAHGKNEIVCEGCMRGTKNVLRFSSSQAKEEYMRDECENQHCTCRIFLMMVEVYEEGQK